MGTSSSGEGGSWNAQQSLFKLCLIMGLHFEMIGDRDVSSRYLNSTHSLASVCLPPPPLTAGPRKTLCSQCQGCQLCSCLPKSKCCNLPNQPNCFGTRTRKIPHMGESCCPSSTTGALLTLYSLVLYRNIPM